MLSNNSPLSYADLKASPTYPSSERISCSSTSEVSPVYTPNQTQLSNTSRILQINTPGESWNNFHSTAPDSEISITECTNNNTSESESFRSIRVDKSRGNSILFLTATNKSRNEGREVNTRVAQTTSRSMPGKHTTIKLFSLSAPHESLIEELEMRAKACLFSRTVMFTSSRFGAFAWRYAGRREKKAFAGRVGSEERQDNLLILERVGNGGKGEPEVVARLSRGDETRSAGSSRRNHEGNGGRLECDFKALVDGGNGGETEARELEALVISTCLYMLKREIDAQYSSQVVIVS